MWVCLCVFVSLPYRVKPSFGTGDLEATPASCPHPGPTVGSLPSLCLVWASPQPQRWVLENISAPLPAQGPCLLSPPSLCGGRGVTLQVSRRVQIFLVSGFITPHCLLRSHSFPVGKVVPMSPKAIFSRPRGGELGLRQNSQPSMREGCSLPNKLLWAPAALSWAQEPSPCPLPPRHSFWGL